MARESILLILTILAVGVQPSLIDRSKRQTVVSTNANTNGQADNVETDAMAHHYKTVDNVVGMNVSSGGNATGANSANIDNEARGQVGDTQLNATGNVNSLGTHSNSYSDIFAVIHGENKTVSSFQQGKASGVGDTQTEMEGGAVMSKDGELSPHKHLNKNKEKTFSGSDKTVGTAGATGSLASQSEVLSNQVLTWDSLMAQLVGSAVAEGLGNGQANVDLGAGNANDGVEMNGLVSGVQTGNGNINAQVNGNANMDGSHHDLTGNMYGRVNGSMGNSTLVGATHIQSNTTGNTSISAFGDSKVNTNGASAIDLLSETSLDNQKSAQGNILMNSTADGTDKNMKIESGLRGNDNQGGVVAVGNGQIDSQGSDNSNASIIVDTVRQENGDTRVIAKGEGTAQSSNNQKNSTLNINTNTDINNSDGVHNLGTANGTGKAFGEWNNVTGTSFLNVDQTGTNGNAMMEARGGGAGPSAAETNSDLFLNENGVPRNLSVNGAVKATGDNTSVHSISVVTDYAGQQTLSNYQHAKSLAQGSSSASASNYGVLKRKKRSNLGVLFDKLF